MTQDYIRYYLTGANSTEQFKSDEELAAEGWLCTQCWDPKPGTGAIDIQINEKRPAYWPLSFVTGPGVNLARRDFLSLFGEENVARDLLLGTVSGPDGTPIKDWVSWRGRHTVVIRGTEGKDYTGPGHEYVGYRYCACGNIFYHALGKNYLNPAPPPDVKLLEGHLADLVVPADLAAPRDVKRKGVGIMRLKVLDPAPDGYGNLAPPS